jgi:hypothetical protein
VRKSMYRSIASANERTRHERTRETVAATNLTKNAAKAAQKETKEYI